VYNVLCEICPAEAHATAVASRRGSLEVGHISLEKRYCFHFDGHRWEDAPVEIVINWRHEQQLLIDTHAVARTNGDDIEDTRE
jgi:hypothetical protein